MFSRFSLAGQTHTTFAPLELVQAVSESAFDLISCDLPSFARAIRVLRPHAAMLAPVQPTLAEDLVPISGSKQPARILRRPEAPSRRWRSSQ